MAQNRTDLILGLKAEQGDMIKSINELIKGMNKLEDEMGDLGKKADDTGKRASSAFQKFGKDLKRVGKSMVRSIGGAMRRVTTFFGPLGFIGIIGKSIHAAGAFEKAITEVGTLIKGDATKIVKQYSKEIIELSKSSEQSAVELSKGLYQVISAGVKDTDTAAGSMKLLEIASKASTAGLADMGATTDVLTTALNAYGMSANDAGIISDQLFTAVRLGKTTLSEVASQLGMVASIAAGAGVELGEVNAALVAMTKGGLSTDIATTSLRGIIISLLKPSTKLAALMKKLGFESSAAALEQKGLVGVMELLNKETGGNAKKLNELIPETRAFTGATILAGTGVDNLRMALEEMGNAAGATDEAYEKMTDTFSFQVKVFWNKLNALFISIGNKLMPTILEKMNALGIWVDNNGDKILEWGERFFTIIQKVGEAIGFVIEGLADLASFAGETAAEIFMKASRARRGVADPGRKRSLVEPKDIVASFSSSKADETLSDLMADATGKGVSKGIVEGTKEGTKKVKTVLTDAQKASIAKRKAEEKEGIEFAKRLRISVLEGEEKIRAKMEVALANVRKKRFKNEIDLVDSLAAVKKKFEDELDAYKDKKADEAIKKEIKRRKALATLNKHVVGAQIGMDLSLMRRQEVEDFKQRRAGAGGKEEVIESFFDRVATGFAEKIGSMVAEAGATFFGAVSKPFEQIMQIFIQALEGEGLSAIQNLVGEAVKLWENLVQNLGPVLEFLAREGIPKILDAFIAAIPIIIDALIENLPTMITSIIDRIPDIVKAFVKKIPEITAAVIKAIPGIAYELAKAIVEILTDLTKGMATGGIDLIGNLFGIGSIFHKGGVVGDFGKTVSAFGSAIKAHSGLFVTPSLRGDEVPIIAQAGEGIIRKEITAAMGGKQAIDSINAGRGIGGNSVVNNLTVNHLLSDDTEKVLDDMSAESWRNDTSKVKELATFGMVPGYSPAR